MEDLKRIQEIQSRYIGVLDIQVSTRADEDATRVALTKYPEYRIYCTHRLKWGKDNTKEFEKIEKEIKKLCEGKL